MAQINSAACFLLSVRWPFVGGGGQVKEIMGSPELLGPKDRFLRSRKSGGGEYLANNGWDRAPRAWPGVCCRLSKGGSLSPQLLCGLGPVLASPLRALGL